MASRDILITTSENSLFKFYFIFNLLLTTGNTVTEISS